MGKLFSVMARLAAVASLLLALPGLARVAQLRTMLNRSDAAAEQEGGENLSLDKNAKLPDFLGGEGLDLQGFNLAKSLPQMMGLISGNPAVASKSKLKPKPKPTGPSTLIRYVGPEESSGKSPGTVVRQLPPGANAAIVDGRLQIYDPTDKTKTSKR